MSKNNDSDIFARLALGLAGFFAIKLAVWAFKWWESREENTEARPPE